MHGMIFREFFTFAERATSEGFVDDMLRVVKPDGPKEYLAHGPFDVTDLTAFMDYLSRHTGYDPVELSHDFGRFLFTCFTLQYSHLFRDQTMVLDFLEGIESHIHEQVRDIVPNGKPPNLRCSRLSQDELVIHYQSHRPFADLCAGLIAASLDHFGVEGRIDRQLVAGDKSEAIFTITTMR